MSFSNVCAEGELEMEYELRVVVEKVLVSTQEVVKRDTLKTYDVKPPESVAYLGLADNGNGPLVDRLRGVNQSVGRSRIAFATPNRACMFCVLSDSRKE